MVVRHMAKVLVMLLRHTGKVVVMAVALVMVEVLVTVVALGTVEALVTAVALATVEVLGTAVALATVEALVMAVALAMVEALGMAVALATAEALVTVDLTQANQRVRPTVFNRLEIIQAITTIQKNSISPSVDHHQVTIHAQLMDHNTSPYLVIPTVTSNAPSSVYS